MRMHARQRFAPTVMAACVAAAFAAPALAQEDEDVARLVTPMSWVEAGAGYVSRDAPRFGIYNGLYDKGGELLLDFDYLRRDNATGTWYIANGRNLGLDNREARAEYVRQGNFGLSIDYSEISRREPYRILTGLDGIGTNELQVSGTSPREVRLALERRIATIGFEKYLGRNLKASVTFRNQEKEGSRIFGRGTPGAMEFLAEPQNYTMQQLDATLGYADQRFQLSGGYYGTAFDNDATALNVAGGAAGLAGGAAPFTPIGLPPDNDSHQFHVAGGYNFTRLTRMNFKYARQRATQDDQFILAPASTVNRDNLGGRVDTTLAQLGLASRPLPALTLNASLRYEDRDDKTPLAQYFTAVTATSTSDGFNEPRSIRSTFGKLEALYGLGGGWRVGGKYEYDRRERNTSPVRVVSHRDETEEHTLGLEARRSMSDTVTGSVSYQHSERDGSDFELTVRNDGSPGSNLLAPLMLADRERDRVRALVDWSVNERVGVQLVAEESRDDYDGGNLALGPRSGRARHYGVDATLAVAEGWTANAFAGVDETRAEQDTQASAPTGQLWRAKLAMRGEGFGVGVRGTVAGRFETAVELSRFDNRARYDQFALTGNALPVIPDIHYRQTTLNANVRMPLGRNAAIRLQYIHDRWSTDEWTWANFTYSDGTQVLQDRKQRVNFIGVAYTMTFH